MTTKLPPLTGVFIIKTFHSAKPTSLKPNKFVLSQWWHTLKLPRKCSSGKIQNLRHGLACNLSLKASNPSCNEIISKNLVMHVLRRSSNRRLCRFTFLECLHTTEDTEALLAILYRVVNSWSPALSKRCLISWCKTVAVETSCTSPRWFAKRRPHTRWLKLILNTSLTPRRFPTVHVVLNISRKYSQSKERGLWWGARRKLEITGKPQRDFKKAQRFLPKNDWNRAEMKSIFLRPNLSDSIPEMMPPTHTPVKEVLNASGFYTYRVLVVKLTDEENHLSDNLQILLIAHQVPFAVPCVAQAIRHVVFPRLTLRHSRPVRNYIIFLCKSEIGGK